MSRVPTAPVSRTRLTPSETTRRASTSRPESVSSRIAILGFSSSSCRISWRFFSPPEKPSLTLRSAKDGSMDRLAMASRTSLTHSRSLGASPRTAVAAVRRKLETGTRALVDLHREYVGAVEGDRPGGDGVLRVTGQRIGQGGLPGAVRAHDRV